MISVAVFLALLCRVTSGQTPSPSELCSSANVTLKEDTDCYESYRSLVTAVEQGYAVDQNQFNRVCMVGNCRSKILDFHNLCNDLEEVCVVYSISGAYAADC